MIRNDRQFSIMRARAARLEELNKQLEARRPEEPREGRLELELATVRGELERINMQLKEYEGLRSGQLAVTGVQSLEDLPRALIQARIAAGLSQRELAERLGIKEQQIQRYEATNYESASLTRLQEIARALGISQLGQLGVGTSALSADAILSRLSAQGLDKEMVLQRIAPEGLRAGNTDAASTLSLVGRLARVFDTVLDRLLLDTPELGNYSAAVAAFKSRANARESSLSAYASYAHYLARLTLEGTRDLRPAPIPTSPAQFRELIQKHGEFCFKSALLASWELGVPVLPLADPGAFQAAYWRHEGRGVIVLKQRHRKAALWFFDLLHELWHAAETPGRSEREVIDLAPTDPERRESPIENAANAFAAEVLFGEDPSHLFDLVWIKSGGQAGLMKRTVQLVARKENIEVGALAYFVAHRLRQREIDWWGSATNLQPPSEDPWVVCRDVFLTRFRLNSLSRLDQDLLLQGLTDNLGTSREAGGRGENG